MSAIEPFDQIPTSTGAAPLYLVPFDKMGRCEGPKTLEHVLSEGKSGNFNRVYIFSHGWNNVFKDAISLYREYFSEYFDLRKKQGVSDTADKPLLIGIIWPSTVLVSDSDATPKFCGHTSARSEKRALFRQSNSRARACF